MSRTQKNNERSRLPDAITSDRELAAWCNKHVPGFVGVADAASFPSLYPTMGPGASAIINLDPDYKRGGTHWVAIKRSGEGVPTTYYKDSFGAPPPAVIVRAAEGLVYGNRIEQDINERNCGKRAAEWLRDMAAAASRRREIEHFIATEV